MTPPKNKKDNRARSWIEIILLLAGAVGVSAWLASLAAPAIWQDWENWVFDRELLGQPADVSGYLTAKEQRIVREVSTWLGRTPPAADQQPAQVAAGNSSPSSGPAPPGMRNDELVGRLTIPRLHLTAIVREGVGQETLGLAVGHVPGTALPGQNGNVAVAGHRDTLFRGLGAIHDNDLIQFETFDGSYVYEVASTKIVNPRDVGVLRAGRYPELTLVTCYPFNYVGSAPDRFIVKARQISSMVRSVTRPVVSDAKASGSAGETLVSATGEEPTSAQTSAIEKPAAASEKPDPGRVNFNLARGHSRTLEPGISVGVDTTDVADQRMNGWMWILQDRRTIWLRGQGTQDPVVFYGPLDGKKRELWITAITPNSASGYLELPRE